MAKVCAGRAIANSGYGCYINHSYLLRTGPSPTLAMGAILTILRYLPRTGPSPTMAIEAILTIVAICTIVHHPPPTTHHPPPTTHHLLPTVTLAWQFLTAPPDRSIANGAREGGFGATKGRYWRRAERPEWAHSDPGEAGYLPSRSLTIRDHRGGRAERPHSTSRPADRQRRQGGEIWREERAGG